MSELEVFMSEQIKILVPNYSTLELNAIVSASSYSIEFFAVVNGKRMQCFEMIDNGIFSEKNFNIVSSNIANYCRQLPDFDVNGVNRYAINLK